MKDDDFEKAIRAVRDQAPGWGEPYTTPVEKSRAAAEYLISQAGKPLDFDQLHEKFQLTMDKGGPLFPYDTLNWHTHLWLKHEGYEYKLFCLETKKLEEWVGKKRYILVDKQEKMVWGDEMEEDHRSFNNEFDLYRGAYYNSKFEPAKPPKRPKK